MAVAGDILFKLAVDFAQFSSGMKESVSRLEEFGKATADQAEQINKLGEQLKHLAEGLGVMWAVDKVLEFGKALEETAAQITTTATALGYTTDEYQAFTEAAKNAGLTQEQATSLLSKWNISLGEAQAGSKKQIDALNELNVKIRDGSGNLRDRGELLAEASVKLDSMTDATKRSQIEVALFGKTGQDVNVATQQWALGVDVLSAKYQKLIFPPDVLAKLVEFKTRSEEARREIEVAVAPWWVAIKTEGIELLAKMMQSFSQSLKVINSEGPGAVGIMRNVANLLTLGAAGAAGGGTAAQIEDVSRRIAKLGNDYNDAAETIKNAKARWAAGGNVSSMEKSFIDSEEQRLGKIRQDIYGQTQLLDQLKGGGLPTLPPVTVPGGGVSNPPIAGSGKAADEVLARIRELQGQAKAASDALAAMMKASVEVPLEEVKRAADMQKAVDDIVAKFAKTPAAAPFMTQIRAAAEEMVHATQALKDYDKAAAEAEQTEARFGDGTKAYTKLLYDLQKQQDTHRASTEALTRAQKAQQEQIDLAATSAKRYDDNLGSLAAGFQAAAMQQSRASDLFAAGGQLFNNVFQTMGQALTEFVTTGQINFAKLAQSFAAMLADMAAKLAAQAALKAILGAIGGGIGGSVSAGAAADPAAATAAYGSYAPEVGSLSFGGPRAAGGPVFPGIAYTVGEQGAERFVPSTAGTIVPNAGQGGGVTINNFAPGVDVNAQRQPSGDLAVTVQAVRRALTRDVARGGNDFATAFERTYGMSRATA